VQLDYKFIRLTALWAFVEAGLGGVLHAFHLPFTGIILGGFAILIISLIAHNYTNPFPVIIQATLVVLAIKAIVNPATPAAYMAVAFQGLLGAVVYSVSRKNYISHFVLATLSMLESAAQKLLMMTLFFGASFWEGVAALGKTTTKIFGNGSLTIVIVYLLIFFIWGILLSIWMYRLPLQIALRKDWYNDIEAVEYEENKSKSDNKIRNAFFIIIIAIGFLSYTSISESLNKGLLFLLRTTAALLIWQLLLPFWRKKISKWGNKFSENNQHYRAVNTQMNFIKGTVKPIYAKVSIKFTGGRKWKEFLLALIIVSLKNE
jgi:hypothetical protein